MRQELIDFGIEMGLKRERIDEVFLRGQALGIQTGTNPAWIKAIADAPDMTVAEKTYLAFLVAGILVEAVMSKNRPNYEEPGNRFDPMFV